MKYKLGKLAPKKDPRTLKFSDYLAPSLPPLPSAIDWSGKVTAIGMLANDEVGDCTIAGADHMDECWTANAGTEVVFTDAQALADYSALSGYAPDDPDSDTGCALLDVLKYWRNTGMAGRKIAAFVEVEPKNTTHLKVAVALLGGAYLGINVPSRAMAQFDAGQPWTDTADDTVDGGHCVCGVGYGPANGADGLTLVTWGQKQFASWDWLALYMDESYAVLSGDWLAATGSSPSGFNLQQLTADLQAIRH